MPLPPDAVPITPGTPERAVVARLGGMAVTLRGLLILVLDVPRTDGVVNRVRFALDREDFSLLLEQGEILFKKPLNLTSTN